MDGELHLESKLDEGACFKLNFELEIDVSETAEVAIEEELDLPQRNILICEDNLVNQRILEMLLQKLNCKVSLANDGTEALHQLMNHEFDLVFMDIQMPDLNGNDVTRKIHCDKPGFSTPIVALTASALQEDREECIAAGMKGFLSKPIREQDLKVQLNKWL